MSKWLNLSKRVFKRLSVREQLLLLIFVLTIVGLWAASQFQRAHEWNETRRLTNAILTDHQMYLDRHEEFELGLAAALERVDPSKTKSATELAGRIDQLVRQAGLSSSADIDPVRSQEGEIFNDHNIRVRLSRIAIAKVIEFNSLIRKETPYITVKKVDLAANRRNPAEIDARFEINSFELKNLN